MKPTTQKGSIAYYAHEFIRELSANTQFGDCATLFTAKLEEFFGYCYDHEIFWMQLIEEKTIRNFVSDRLENRSIAYIQTYLLLIKTFIKWMVTTSRDPFVNPFQVEHLDRVDQILMSHFLLLRFERVLVKCGATLSGYRDKAIMRLMANSGLTIDEVCNLQLSALDLSTGSISLIDPKAKTNRLITLPMETFREIDQYITKRHKLIKSNFVFTEEDGSQLSASSVRIMLETRSKVAGPKISYTEKTLRDVFITSCIAAQLTPFECSTLLGLSSYKEIEQYEGVSEEELLLLYSIAPTKKG